MLLTKLRAINNQGDTLNLPLDNHSGGYLVTDIQGLGPAKATLSSKVATGTDGEQFNSGRLEPRNVIIKLGLTPDYASSSVYALRAQLYPYFMPNTEVLLKLDLFDKFSDSVIYQNLNLEIKGVIESFEVDQFVKDPTVDLSIMCYAPALVDPEPVIFEGSTVFGLHEVVLNYPGSLETGFLFSIFPNRTLSSFVIYHRPSNQKLYSAHFDGELLAGDVLKINSVRGDKYVRRLRNGIESTQLFALHKQSKWLELDRGVNHLRVYASGDPVPYQIEYTTKYGGV